MYKLYAMWSAPKPADQPAFEKHYLGIHAPLAAAVPEIRRLVTSLTAEGLEGGAPAVYRVAEMIFDSKESLERSTHSPEWKKVREDAGVLIEKFGVTLSVAMGDETAGPARSSSRPSTACSPPRAPCASASTWPARPARGPARVHAPLAAGADRLEPPGLALGDRDRAGKRAKLADIYRRGGAEYLEQALRRHRPVTRRPAASTSPRSGWSRTWPRSPCT